MNVGLEPRIEDGASLGRAADGRQFHQLCAEAGLGIAEDGNIGLTLLGDDGKILAFFIAFGARYLANLIIENTFHAAFDILELKRRGEVHVNLAGGAHARVGNINGLADGLAHGDLKGDGLLEPHGRGLGILELAGDQDLGNQLPILFVDLVECEPHIRGDLHIGELIGIVADIRLFKRIGFEFGGNLKLGRGAESFEY